MISRPNEVLKFRVGYLVIPDKAEEVGGRLLLQQVFLFAFLTLKQGIMITP